MSDRLYFNHIPRTAGTSVRMWLNSFFDATSACPHLHRHEFRQAPEEELRSYRFFSGHLQNLPLTLFGGELPVVTILREPRTHFASIITYNAKRRTSPQDCSFINITQQAKKLLRTHIDKPYTKSWGAINLQTKWLNNVDPRVPHVATASDFEAARGVLESALAVGTLDRLQDFADLVCFKMRWPHRLFDQHLNSSPSNDVLDDVDHGYLDDLLDYDIRLYRHAKHMLDRAMEECFGRNGDSASRAALLNERAWAP